VWQTLPVSRKNADPANNGADRKPAEHPRQDSANPARGRITPHGMAARQDSWNICPHVNLAFKTRHYPYFPGPGQTRIIL
jgi:hypothetical protein